MNFFIVNYNTSLLVKALINNLQYMDSNPQITILDNSDKEPLLKSDYAKIFDNTQGQIIDFAKEWGKLTDKPNTANGSWKHSMSIEWFYKYTNEPFILLDSDVIIKHEFNDIVKNDILFAGDVSNNRVMPMFLYINVPLCKEHSIRFFDCKTITPFKDCDTGYYFLEQCKHLNYLHINMFDYIFHFGGASYDAFCLPNYKTEIFGNTFGHSDIDKHKRFIFYCRKYIPHFEDFII